MKEKIIYELLKESHKAFKKNEIPVGCVITKNDKIISKSHNSKEHDKKVISHAEIKAIIKASKKINDWRLNECELYTTLMPCPMCADAINQSRIKKVFYIYPSTNKKNDYISKIILEKVKLIQINKNCLEKNELDEFFKKIRNTNVSRETL